MKYMEISYILNLYQTMYIEIQAQWLFNNFMRKAFLEKEREREKL